MTAADPGLVDIGGRNISVPRPSCATTSRSTCGRSGSGRAPSAEAIADDLDVERFDFDEITDILEAGGKIRPVPLVVLTADAPITDVPKPGLPDIGAATAAPTTRPGTSSPSWHPAPGT